MIKASDSNINIIYLMMGFACNFNCKYCIQTPTCNNLNPIIDDDVFKYIKRLVNMRDKDKNKLKIMFWGGEPLLYISTIKNVLNRLGNSVRYGVVTNGSLLTDEFVDLANQYNISVALSYDGFNTDITRKINILENRVIRERFNNINNRGILSVLSAYNYDFNKLQENAYQYCKKDTGITLEMLKITWNMPEDIYKINKELYRKSLQYTADKAYKDILSGIITNDVNLFLPHLENICYVNSMYKDVPRCLQFYNTMNIDLNGNVYICHNSNTKIGSIKDNRITLGVRYEDFLQKSKNDKCMSCKYYNLCQGGCPLENKYKHITCELRMIFFDEVNKLANRLIQSYLDVDLEV